jgi:hypothetical protein
MSSKEFTKLENWIFEAYKENLSLDLDKDLDNNNKELLNIFPLFHPNSIQRVDQLQSNDIKKITEIQPMNIENFPARGYFKLALFFKLSLLFLLFAGNMKGYNFPLFVSFLVIYYWYT